MSTFFKMTFLWVYFILVLGVTRIRSKSSPLTDREESLEVITKSIEQDNDNPFDLSQLDLRRNRGRLEGKDIWSWDLYCHLQPKKGDCHETITRYYYDAQLDECRRFNYSGCNKNQNNFETATECELRCKGANFMGVNENNLPTVCYLQPDSGLCLAFMTNYYFDVNEMKCMEFMFGGCGGNLNRFQTKAACNEHCSIRSGSPPIRDRSTTESGVPPETTREYTRGGITKI